MSLCTRLVALLAICSSLSAAALAQSAVGNISGTVSDPNGARVPNAAVTVTGAETNLQRRATTSEAGDFAVQLLPPGRYRIEVTAQGFQTRTVEAVVSITQTTTVEVELSVGGAIAESVEVAAETPLLQQESSQVGRVIEEQTIRQLPLPTRNFQQLLTLSPGAYSSVANNTELGRGDAVITVNGQRPTSNNVRINGIDANSVGTNSTPNIAVPATDSLQEFIVLTSAYDASHGRGAGGNVEAVTKSGTNELHGNLYEFFRNEKLNANDFFLNAAGRPRPVLRRNQFGGTLGGPLIRDRLFFFGSYQGTRERNGASLNNSLTFPVIDPRLTDNNRTAAGLAAAFGTPMAPLTEAQISPVALALLQARLPNGQFAVPSAATPSGLTPVSGVSRFTENQYNANLDLALGEKHSLSGKGFFASNPTFQANYNFAGLGNGNQQLPGFGGDLDIIQTLVSLTDTYVVSPNVINQARFGFSRLRVTSVPEEPLTAASVGITNPLGDLYPGLPTIFVTGQFSLGSSPLADQSSRINSFTLSDTLSWNVGRHRLRFGGEYRPSQVNFFFNAFTRGQINFPTFRDFLTGGSATTVSIIGSGVFDRSLRTDDFAGYVQDDFKVTDRLTLNLGLRYELFNFPRDARGRLVNFIPSQFRAGTAAAPAGPPNGLVQAGNGSLPGVPTVSDRLIPTDKNNFAPRVGFAYRLTESDRLALRAGYGIYYDRPSTRLINTQLFNYPYLALGVGLVAPLPLPIFRSFANPFIPLPQPGVFPVSATVPSPLTSLSPLGVPISGLFVDTELRTPYVQQYNANVQYEFARDWLLEVGYVGSKGTKLLQVVTLNQASYNQATGLFNPPPFGTSVSANRNVTGGLQQVQSSGNSNYNSLQLSVTKRFSRGLQLLSAYTLGKWLDTYTGAPTGINELTTVPGDQLFDLRSNYGPADFDRRHRFVTSFVYDLPKFDFDSGLARALLNNFQLNGIVTLQTGTPFSVVEANGTSVIQRANFAPGFAGEVEGSGPVTSRLGAYFNTAAFTRSTLFLAGTTRNPAFDPNAPFGNTGRNILYGPGQKNVDFSVVKFLPFTERLRGEFRTEFFNLFNFANFNNPGNNVLVPATFGRITSTSSGPRVIQFAFKVNF